MCMPIAAKNNHVLAANGCFLLLLVVFRLAPIGELPCVSSQPIPIKTPINSN